MGILPKIIKNVQNLMFYNGFWYGNLTIQNLTIPNLTIPDPCGKTIRYSTAT